MWLLLALACGGVNNDTVAPPGDPTRFDPIASLDSVAAYAGPGARLVSLRTSWVRSNGTIDLTKAKGVPVTYQFTREVPAPKDAPPIGAGGSVDGKYHADVTVELGAPGSWRHVTSGGSEWDYEFRGMERNEGSIQPGAVQAPPGPTCALSSLYQQVPGIPAGAVASVDFDGSRYELSIDGTQFRGEFDARCHPTAGVDSPIAPTPAEDPPTSPRDERRDKAKIHPRQRPE